MSQSELKYGTFVFYQEFGFGEVVPPVMHNYCAGIYVNFYDDSGGYPRYFGANMKRHDGGQLELPEYFYEIIKVKKEN